MSWLASLGGLLTAAAVVVVQPGETLEQIAERSLGDAKAASELKALNRLAGDELPSGATLRLPGPERMRALSALTAARNALNQSDLRANGRTQAAQSLEKAEQLFQSAKYEESAAAADAAWRLVSGAQGQSTRFAIQVAEGQTKVTSHAGRPVRVERDGLSRAVRPGEALTITPQSFPGAAPAVPELLSPADLARVGGRPTEKGIAVVNLSWRSVGGAVRYLVDVLPVDNPAAKPIALASEKPSARVSLAAGRYAWSVRAVADQGGQSAPSSRRTFELSIEPLRLEVKQPHWK